MLTKTFAGILDIVEHDVWMFNHTRFGNVYEEHIILGPLKPILEKSKVLLDIGANNGSHSISYAFLSPPDATIYAFEPQSKMFKRLENTLKVNGYGTKVKAMNVAVGDSIKKCTMESIDRHVLSEEQIVFSGVSLGDGGEEVHMITVDSMNLESCDFMKVDVEGAESMVLGGASTTIDKFKPVIMFEHIDEMNLTKETSPFRILSGHGYKTFQYLDWCNWLTWHPDNPPDLPIQPCLPTIFC
jgi:FkbM family methyltransferase